MWPRREFSWWCGRTIWCVGGNVWRSDQGVGEIGAEADLEVLLEPVQDCDEGAVDKGVGVDH